jgi:hypothetical protein
MQQGKPAAFLYFVSVLDFEIILRLFFQSIN